MTFYNPLVTLGLDAICKARVDMVNLLSNKATNAWGVGIGLESLGLGQSLRHLAQLRLFSQISHRQPITP